jgi:hypothetical protein
MARNSTGSMSNLILGFGSPVEWQERSRVVISGAGQRGAHRSVRGLSGRGARSSANELRLACGELFLYAWDCWLRIDG